MVRAISTSEEVRNAWYQNDTHQIDQIYTLKSHESAGFRPYQYGRVHETRAQNDPFQFWSFPCLILLISFVGWAFFLV